MPVGPRVLVAALVAATALALGAAPASARTKSFRMPSNNIHCLYRSSGGPGPLIRCDVNSLNDTAFTVDRRHKGKRIHVTDSVFNRRAKVLRYGRLLRVGPFSCRSRTTGLTCKSGVSQHGFTVSRKRQKRF